MLGEHRNLRLLISVISKYPDKFSSSVIYVGKTSGVDNTHEATIAAAEKVWLCNSDKVSPRMAMKFNMKIVIIFVLLGSTKTLTRAEERSGGVTIS